MKELTVENILRAVLEFIFIWLSQILYHRNIYRSELFSRVISYDLIAYRSRHPKLNEYINGLIQSFLRIQLQGSASGKVGALYVMLYSTKSNRIREKYILKFTDLIALGLTQIPATLTDATVEQETADETPVHIDDLLWEEIFTQLKSVLFKHMEELKRICISQVELPEDLFFKVLIDVDESLSLQQIDNEWVQISVRNTNVEPLGQSPSNVVLIGDVNLGILNFDVHNEYSV